MPNWCLTLSQTEVVKKDHPNVLSTSRLSRKSMTKMPASVTRMTAPASRAPVWNTPSAVTSAPRRASRRGGAPATAAPAAGPRAVALRAGEGGRAIHLDSLDELLAALDHRGRQRGVAEVAAVLLAVVGAPPQVAG